MDRKPRNEKLLLFYVATFAGRCVRCVRFKGSAHGHNEALFACGDTEGLTVRLGYRRLAAGARPFNCPSISSATCSAGSSVLICSSVCSPRPPKRRSRC